MHKYVITIVMADGSTGKAWGLFATAWDAIDSVMTTFTDAKRIGARRLA
jgi:hypothetical protein